jgi:hypothetical protein
MGAQATLDPSRAAGSTSPEKNQINDDERDNDGDQTEAEHVANVVSGDALAAPEERAQHQFAPSLVDRPLYTPELAYLDSFRRSQFHSPFGQPNEGGASSVRRLRQ